VSLPSALVLLTMAICGSMFVSRRLQPGYLDFLTPLLGLYFLHSVTRAWFDWYWPGLYRVNTIVQMSGEQGLVDALLLTTASLAVLTVAYLSVMRFRVAEQLPSESISVPQFDLAFGLLWFGFICRLLLRLHLEQVVEVADWLTTPVETLGWTALAGLFLMAFRSGRLEKGSTGRKAAAVVALVGAIAILVVDGRFAVSRENPLQLGLALLCGHAMGGGMRLRRLVVISVIVSLPVFVWIGAMKSFQDDELGEGRGYVEGMSAVRAEKQQSMTEFVLGSIQGRLHGLDSVVVCRQVVPDMRPFEDGSVWTRILVSAFVPRAIAPNKRVGWGVRFAVEFWGLSARHEGSASVGISQIGNLYVYGGVPGCLFGMAMLGAGLSLLAEALRRRRDAFGYMLFFLTAITICQVERDLEVALGGVLKLLAVFGAVVAVRRLALGHRRDDAPSPGRGAAGLAVDASAGADRVAVAGFEVRPANPPVLRGDCL